MNFNKPKLKYWTAKLLLLLCLNWTVRGDIRISEDGGYSNIIVKISDSLDMHKCSAIISGLKDLFEQSSESLHRALFGKVYLRGITIVIPSSWPSSVCGVTPPMYDDLSDLRLDVGHIEVTQADTFHGYYPHTQQSGGCGQPGEVISIPHTWLTTNNITEVEARTFVHLWAKYRYGILDETGFTGDSLYPSYYRRDGNILPTTSHNGVLTGVWLSNGEECHPDTDQDCIFVPDSLRSSGVSCSLGNGLNLADNERYCNRSETWMSPTKHNIVCGGRSPVEVIMSHPDLMVHGKDQQVANVRPEIRIAREPVTKYVLALETSGQMADSDHWTWVRKAAHKFIRHDLPVNSHLAILSVFSSNVSVEHGLVQVDSDSVRTVLADTIPGRYHLDTEHVGDTCVSCVLRTTLDTVLGDGHVSGVHVIVVTTAHATRHQERAEIRDMLENRPIRLSSIIIPSQSSANTFQTLSFYDDISQQSGGQSFKLAETGYGIDLLVGLNTAFSQVLRSDAHIELGEASEIVSMSEHYSNSDDNESNGAFIIDESLGRDTIFGIYVQDEEDHLIKSVTFEDSDGNKYGPFTKMSSALDPFNIKTINYVGEEPPFGNAQKVGRQWRYSIKWSQNGAGVTKNIVSVTSKPRSRDNGAVVNVHVWTSHVSRHVSPVKVFAKVSIGSSPVLNATVYLDVEVENSNGTIFVLLPSLMVDDGHGEADMTGQDGVYSGYIPSYPSDGRYKLSVRVTTSEQTRTFPQGEIVTRGQPCCGSSTQPPEDKLIPSLTFSRNVPGPVLQLRNTGDIDAVAPARSVDLTVVSDNGGVLTARWSNNDNTVVSFKFIFSPDITDLIDTRSHPQVLREIQVQTGPTKILMNTAQLQFSLYGRDYFIAVVSVGANGRHSAVSNIVHVHQDAPVVDESELVSGTGASYDLLQPVSDRDWIMVAVVCAIFAVLLCVTIVMTAYLCWYKHKRSRAKVSTGSSSSDVNVVSSGSSDQTDATSFDLDMKNLCPSNDTPPPGYDLSITRVEHVSPRDTSPQSSQQSRVTPIYWSASQLLSKLDTDPGAFSGTHLYHKDAVIPDEFCVTVSDLHYTGGHPGHPHGGHRTYSDSSLGFSDCDNSTRYLDKMPPPTFPKPKNITQV